MAKTLQEFIEKCKGICKDNCEAVTNNAADFYDNKHIIDAYYQAIDGGIGWVDGDTIHKIDTKFLPESSGGGVAFKSFDLKLSDDTTMRFVDMGNDMVCISFVFSGKKTVNDFTYTIPTDNAEFNTWFSGKVLMFALHPIVQGYDNATEGGLQGIYSNFDFIAMMGAQDTELGGMLMLSPSGGTTIKGNIDSLMFTTIVSLLAMPALS